MTSILLVAVSVTTLTSCSTEIRPPELSDVTEADLARQAEVDNQRALDTLLEAYPDADVPEVDRVRFVDLNEHPQAMADCLTSEGFVSEADVEAGSYSVSAPAGQEISLAVATYVCSLRYPINPRSTMPLNDDQIRFLYEYYVQVATPCLAEEGYDVPPPPSLQTFIGSYEQGVWQPYALVVEAATSDEEWQRINRLCPQTPSGLYG